MKEFFIANKYRSVALALAAFAVAGLPFVHCAVDQEQRPERLRTSSRNLPSTGYRLLQHGAVQSWARGPIRRCVATIKALRR